VAETSQGRRRRRRSRRRRGRGGGGGGGGSISNGCWGVFFLRNRKKDITIASSSRSRTLHKHPNLSSSVPIHRCHCRRHIFNPPPSLIPPFEMLNSPRAISVVKAAFTLQVNVAARPLAKGRFRFGDALILRLQNLNAQTGAFQAGL
jgi:hypothetical protein